MSHTVGFLLQMTTLSAGTANRVGPAGFPEPPMSTTRMEVYGASGPKVAAMADPFAVEIFTSWEGFDQ
jgi:hypothetical protein